MIKNLKRNSLEETTAPTMREAFNKMRTFMLFICIGLGTVFAQAQDYNVTGTIVDEAGEPLPGTSIIEIGTTNGLNILTDNELVFTNYVEDNTYHWDHCFIYSLKTFKKTTTM